MAAAVAQARRAFPSPTNAEALAVLDAFGSPPLSPEDMKLYQGAAGAMTRFRVTAAGWVNPGDKVRDATDAAWWRARYRFASPLWAHLAEQAKRSDAWMASQGMRVVPVLDAQLAKGEPGALAHELTLVDDDLRGIYASSTQDSPPLLWGANGVPFPNPKQLAEEFCRRYPQYCDVKKLPLPRMPRPAIPLWAWLVLGYLVIKDR